MIAESRNYHLPYKKKPNGWLLCVKYRLSESEKWTERRKVATAKTETEAKKLAAQFEKDLLSGKERLSRDAPPAPVTALTLAEAHEKYLLALGEAKAVTTTQESAKSIWLKYFKPILGKVPLRSLSAAHISKLKTHLIKELEKETASAKTINYYLTRFTAFLNWAEEEELIDQVPKLKKLQFKIMSEKDKRIKTNKLKKISEEEFESAVRKSEALHITAFLYLGGHMGLRQGEIAGLRWCDVDLRNNSISIENQKDVKGVLRYTKTGNKDGIPVLFMSDQTKDILTKLKNKNIHHTEYVIARENGTIPHRHRYYDWMHDLFGHSNVHALRRYAITQAAKRLDPPTVQSFARHKNFSMTSQYFSTTESDLKNAAKQISKPLG